MKVLSYFESAFVILYKVLPITLPFIFDDAWHIKDQVILKEFLMKGFGEILITTLANKKKVAKSQK